MSAGHDLQRADDTPGELVALVEVLVCAIVFAATGSAAAARRLTIAVELAAPGMIGKTRSHIGWDEL